MVVDVANSPSFEDAAVLEFFETSGRNLLAAEAAAGVKHHVALSVVGTERMPDSGYFRAKIAQEKLIKASAVPYTIVRATQFFEFVGGIAQSGNEARRVRLPPATLQPIAATTLPPRWRMSRSPRPSTARSNSPGPRRSGSTSWWASCSRRAATNAGWSAIPMRCISARR